MSFYGNITNTSRTHFQFDRIYANRWEMESNKREDGIYAGRFVLVEYDSQLHMDSILRVREETNNNSFCLYSMTDGEPPIETLLTKSSIKKDELVYSSDLEKSPEHGYFAKNCIFYKCTSDFIEGSSEPATFMKVVDGTAEDDYVINYNIDAKRYGRGYDSTVWQKVYVNGEEHYLMVAELNTVIPVFALQADAPTQTPVVPHFDFQSSDIYYKLHHQPSWGMRVKSANLEIGPEFKNGEIIQDSLISYSNVEPINKSDENVTWVRNEYNPATGLSTTLYWHPKTKTWDTEEPVGEEKVKGAIYYNKKGFSPETISLDNGENYIKVEPTGISGNQYDKHDNTGDLSSQPDIQEISIILPALGNSVAEMWNIIYGNADQNNGNKRNLDIAWNSTKGLRMVQKATESDGFLYQKDQVNTLAGAINSVHDLMGMIIETPEVADIEEFASIADNEKIYYHNGKYYQKVINYEYNDEEKIVGPTTLDEDTLNLLSYKEIGVLKSFPSNIYYYGTSNSQYKLETNDYATVDREYYKTKNENESFFTEVSVKIYDKQKYYRYEDYTYKNNDIEPKFDTIYTQIEVIEELKKPYIPNTYYIYNGGGSIPSSVTGSELLSNIKLSEEEFNSNYKYYTIDIAEDGDVYFNSIELFGITENHYYQNSDGYFVKYSDKDSANVIQNSFKFYTIKEIEGTSTKYFYAPETYYITNDNKTEFYLCKDEYLNDNLTYYIKADEQIIDLVKEKYYVSDTYYYKLNNDKYIFDKSQKMEDEERIYYIREKVLHVLTDKYNLMGVGAEWNINVIEIPDGITITTRKPISAMKELNGFARTLNTIHGLILQINNILLTNDSHTRDPYTVQGSINILNDIIAKFDIIAPDQIMIVDDYGRIHSAPYTTAQEFETNHYQHGIPINSETIEKTIIESTEDRWINMEIDTNVKNPKISIKHNFTEVPNTATESTQNEENSSGELELFTPIVDNMGHVVGHNIETIEMPHNFKFISIDEDSDEKKWIVADNHIAKFNITSDNKWIDLSIDPEEKTIKIYHIAATNKEEDTDTHNYKSTPLLFDGTFEVPIITKDKMGHITEIKNHDVQLPTFKVVDDNVGNVLIDLSLNLTNRESSINLITTNLGDLTLNNYNIGTSTDTIVSSDTLSAGLGKLELRLNKISEDLTSLSGLADRVKVLEDADYAQQIRDLVTRIQKLEGNSTV